MNLLNIPERAWNGLAATVRGGKPIPGVGIRTDWTPNGTLVSAFPDSQFLHPWTYLTNWRNNAWEVSVVPGFVNGRPAKISGTPITAADAPVMTPGWRDGLGSIYPAFFKTLGVRKSLKDPTYGLFDPDDVNRTRSLCACDIILSTPRVATKVDLVITSPDAGSVVNGAVATWGDAEGAGTEFTVYSSPDWTPLPEPTSLDWLLGTAVEPTVDEMKIGTLWLVSPPNFDGDPDGTWIPYPQYIAFWNLGYSTMQSTTGVHYNNLTLGTGLALADMLAPMFLQSNNDAVNAISDFYNETTFKGQFYTV